MLCIFIKIQVCDNERISGYSKISNTIRRKEDLKKMGVVFFYLKILKKKL